MFGFLQRAGAGQISKGPAQVRSFAGAPLAGAAAAGAVAAAPGVVVVVVVPAPTPAGNAGPIPKVSRERRSCVVEGKREAATVLRVLESGAREKKRVRRKRRKRESTESSFPTSPTAAPNECHFFSSIRARLLLSSQSNTRDTAYSTRRQHRRACWSLEIPPSARTRRSFFGCSDKKRQERDARSSSSSVENSPKTFLARRERSLDTCIRPTEVRDGHEQSDEYCEKTRGPTPPPAWPLRPRHRWTQFDKGREGERSFR